MRITTLCVAGSARDVFIFFLEWRGLTTAHSLLLLPSPVLYLWARGIALPAFEQADAICTPFVPFVPSVAKIPSCVSTRVGQQGKDGRQDDFPLYAEQDRGLRLVRSFCSNTSSLLHCPEKA